MNGWTDETDGIGGQKGQIDRCEQVHRGDRWTDGMGGQMKQMEQVDRRDRWTDRTGG